MKRMLLFLSLALLTHETVLFSKTVKKQSKRIVKAERLNDRLKHTYAQEYELLQKDNQKSKTEKNTLLRNIAEQKKVHPKKPIVSYYKQLQSDIRTTKKTLTKLKKQKVATDIDTLIQMTQKKLDTLKAIEQHVLNDTTFKSHLTKSRIKKAAAGIFIPIVSIGISYFALAISLLCKGL